MILYFKCFNFNLCIVIIVIFVFIKKKVRYLSTLQKLIIVMSVLSPRHHPKLNIDNIELKDDINTLESISICI